MVILITILSYFALLFLVSHFSGKGGNEAFFRGERKSPWPLVAFGMVGASISGLTFIGVPGWVMGIDMTYMQMCLGFFVGYLVVAFVLLPLYYKYDLTSIYTYLERRFGTTSYKTGSSFFILSKLLGSAAKFYVVCQILKVCMMRQLVGSISEEAAGWCGEHDGLLYFLTVVLTLLFIWLYTRRSGIKALVWTDSIQTLCLIVALVLIMLKVSDMLGFSFGEAMTAVWHDSHSRMFEWDDWSSKQNFWKQFVSGIFVVIVMTGLDQDMMQKNLTCKNLRAAQKDMCSYGMLFAPVNFLFLALGVLLIMLYAKLGMPLPDKGDALLSDIVMDGGLGTACLVFFTIGVIASAFSSADSSMTSLTTSFCVDILGKRDDERLRKVVHLAMFGAFVLCTLAFNAIGSGSVMDLIYTLVSYTYGPLLGLFAFGMLTKRKPCERFVPYIAIASPVVCYIIDYVVGQTTGYKFGYEMLMFNGLLVFVLLYCSSSNRRLA